MLVAFSSSTLKMPKAFSQPLPRWGRLFVCSHKLVGGHSVHQRLRVSYFVFETLPPPLRGPPPSTEGGECWCDISPPRRMLAFAALVPSSSREQRDRRILRGVQTRRGHSVHPRFLQKLVWLWSGRTEFAPTGLSVFILLNRRGRRPRRPVFVEKSNFTYGKSQRVFRRSLHVVQVLHRLASFDCNDTFKSTGLPQQNFATLRMTC